MLFKAKFQKGKCGVTDIEFLFQLMYSRTRFAVETKITKNMTWLKLKEVFSSPKPK